MNDITPNQNPKRNKKRGSRSNIKLETARRIVIFSIATLLLGCAQCSFFPMLDICKRTPDLIMGFILAVCLCDNGKSGMIVAIGAGFFVDAIGGGSIAISPLLYFIYAAIVCAISEKVLKSFPTYMLILLPSMLWRAACTTVLSLIAGTATLSGAFLVDTLLLEMLSTLIFCIPLYFLINLATKPLRTHKRFSF